MTSEHFFELEKRCKKMKKMKIIKIVLVVFIFGISFLRGYYHFWSNETDLSYMTKQTKNISEIINIPFDTPSPKIVNELNQQIQVDKEKENEKYDTLFLEAKIGLSDTVFRNESRKSVDTLGNEEKTLLQKHISEQTSHSAYELSFFYFEAKEYAKVIHWAQKSTNYDSKNVQSWLLYAKACFYLGERKKAVDALDFFLKTNDSAEAKELLKFYKGQE